MKMKCLLFFIYVVIVSDLDSLRWLRSTFVPMMQEEWSLNLCLKDRDYPIGANKSDTITTYMKNNTDATRLIFLSRKKTKRSK
jgi:hypothetical protein